MRSNAINACEKERNKSNSFAKQCNAHAFSTRLHVRIKKDTRSVLICFIPY